MRNLENNIDVRALSLVEVAAHLGVHKATVYRLVYAGKLKVLSGFDRLMIAVAELERFLNRSEVYVPRKRNRKAVVA
jgi:excisionase family DNA binding protein